jgi:hypothetical protein
MATSSWATTARKRIPGSSFITLGVNEFGISDAAIDLGAGFWSSGRDSILIPRLPVTSDGAFELTDRIEACAADDLLA